MTYMYFVKAGQYELAGYVEKHEIVNIIKSRLTRAFIKLVYFISPLRPIVACGLRSPASGSGGGAAWTTARLAHTRMQLPRRPRRGSKGAEVRRGRGVY